MSCKLLCLAMLGVLWAGAPLWAQAKPAPPPLPRFDLDAPDINLFHAAYQEAGAPTILVLAGLVNQASSVEARQERVATGVASERQYLGQGMSLFDPAGDARKFKGDIEEVLVAAGADLVHLDALAERDRREIALLHDRGDRRAVNLLAKKLNADIVIVAGMLSTGAARQNTGARYRVDVEMVDLGRGRKIGGFTFDWMEGTDAYTVKEYAHAVSRKLIEQFARWYAPDAAGTPRPYTLRILGVEDAAALPRVLEAIARLPGVSKVKETSFTSDRRESVTTATLSHAGPMLDLVAALQRLAARELDMRVETADAASGTILLSARRRGAADGGEYLGWDDPDRWRPLIDADHPDRPQIKGQFLEAYRAAGSPTIGLIVNRGVLERDRRQGHAASQIRGLDDRFRQRHLAAQAARPFDAAPGSGGPSTYVVFQPSFAVAGRDAHADHAHGPTPMLVPPRPASEIEEMFNILRMEDLLTERLLRAGVTVKDAAYVRATMDRRARAALFAMEQQVGDRMVMEEGDLTAMLSEEARVAGLDILIVGTGRLVEPRDDAADLLGMGRPQAAPRAEAAKVRYTFRAVRLSDGVTLAATAWSEDLAAQSGELDTSLPGVAGYAAGRLLDQLWAQWAAQQAAAAQPANAAD